VESPAGHQLTPIEHSQWLYIAKKTLTVGVVHLDGHGHLSSWTSGVTRVSALFPSSFGGRFRRPGKIS
jgi:isoaspartyl peptidase/L-asparaginase-like protein (Ntn-hydrolase superfamily)